MVFVDPPNLDTPISPILGYRLIQYGLYGFVDFSKIALKKANSDFTVGLLRANLLLRDYPLFAHQTYHENN